MIINKPQVCFNFMCKPDISSRKDIHSIISSFYEKLISDTKMLPFFEKIIANKELPHHLHIITDFWEDILFSTHNYKNNPMKIHLDFHQKMPFSKEHFNNWLLYFKQSIDENFTGNNAEEMKNRATSIAMVMQLKMDLYHKS